MGQPETEMEAQMAQLWPHLRRGTRYRYIEEYVRGRLEPVDVHSPGSNLKRSGNVQQRLVQG